MSRKDRPQKSMADRMGIILAGSNEWPIQFGRRAGASTIDMEDILGRPPRT